MISASVNTIYVIESLPKDERQTGAELYNDIIKRYAEFSQRDLKLITYHIKLSSKDELLNLLDHLKSTIPNMNLGLLIHIESHGSEDGIHLANGDMVSWSELQEPLYTINYEADNKLYISMANCYGRFLYKTIDTAKKAPFCAFLSTSKKISPSEIGEYFDPFFDQLIKLRDFILAYKARENFESKFYYKDVEMIFDEALIKWDEDINSNPELKRGFFDGIKQDYQKIEENKPWAPKATDQNIDFVLEQAKKDYILQLKNVFLFGKGRFGRAIDNND
ncbi:hypothetical protein [Marivirga arenosa]|uniref:Uncharacterized protein n=1 Tax=Marivirga arenosa TaxID=3059076 RepID=A0AA51ZVL1_9BACT|nr:hypothetical protein [Marivirga sp. BKB1-2]WNB17551.1 hypothetical protein QYS47_34255 [Marivirga sp. BKB1-2]